MVLKEIELEQELEQGRCVHGLKEIELERELELGSCMYGYKGDGVGVEVGPRSIYVCCSKVICVCVGVRDGAGVESM